MRRLHRLRPAALLEPRWLQGGGEHAAAQAVWPAPSCHQHALLPPLALETQPSFVQVASYAKKGAPGRAGGAYMRARPCEHAHAR